MNTTIKAKKKILEQGHITIDQYMSHAIYWACKSSHKKLQIIWATKPAEEISALEKSILSVSSDSESD